MKVTWPQSAQRVLLSLMLMTTGFLTSSVSAQADSTWVPNPTWSQLNVTNADGIFQQDLRVFDLAGDKQTDDPGQHNNVYVRTDVHSIPVVYDCTKVQGANPANDLTSCANKSVQFVVDVSGMYLTNVNITVNGSPFTPKIRLGKIQYVTMTTDENGIAVLSLGVTNKGTINDGKVVQSDDYLGVSVANCNRQITQTPSCATTDAAATPTTAIVGPMTIQFQAPGYYPQVKILNQDNSPAGANCSGVDWASDKTWAWSVFKRSWFGEYACVYAKSYQVGDNVTVPYRVLDIWGTPMADYPVSFNHPSTPPNCGSVRCKWSLPGQEKYTDEGGYVSFTVQNLNNALEACSNVSYNSDTKATSTCVFGVGMNATTGAQPESQDLFWPQFVNDIKMPYSAIEFHVMRRGTQTLPISADSELYSAQDHAYVSESGACTRTDWKADPTACVRNPALAINTFGDVEGSGTAFIDSTSLARLDLTFLANANPDTSCFKILDPKNPARVARLKSAHALPFCQQQVTLYAPDVTITANNGGRVLRVCPSMVAEELCQAANLPMVSSIHDASQMKTSQTFGWQYLSDVLLVGTKPGLTTFSITVGKRTYTVRQEYTTDPLNVRSVVPVVANQNVDVGTTKSVQFQVVDRFGTGYEGINVTLTPSDTDDTSPVNVTSDSNGMVSIDVSSSTSRVGTVTATISDPGGTQIGAAGNEEYGIPASATSATSTVTWGVITNTTATRVTGVAKVGSTLTAVNGTWAGDSPSYTYNWYVCTVRLLAASATKSIRCSLIAGATSPTFKLTTTQLGKYIVASVKAVNAVTPSGVTSYSASTATAVVK